MPDTTINVVVEYGMSMQAYGSSTLAIAVPGDADENTVAELVRAAVRKAHDAGTLIAGWKPAPDTADDYRVVSLRVAEDGPVIDPDGFPLDESGNRYLTKAERAVFDAPDGRALLRAAPQMRETLDLLVALLGNWKREALVAHGLDDLFDRATAALPNATAKE
ncbi:hypothetical protein [Azospirillum sp. sgz302134]